MTPLVLVCGAAGFIGRHVCKEIYNRSITAVGLGRGSLSQQEIEQLHLRSWHSANITLESLDVALQSEAPSSIIHCAGTGSVGAVYSSPYESYINSVESTAAILEYVRTRCHRMTRVIYVSSSAVYGSHVGDSTEVTLCQPVSPYGFLKLASEDLCRAYSDCFGIRVSIIRPFSVYGNGLRKQLLWDAMNKLIAKEYSFLGTGCELRDWIHVDDVAKMLCDVATREDLPDYDVYNACNTKKSVREILEMLSSYSTYSHLKPTFTGAVHTGNPSRLTGCYDHAFASLGWTPSVGLAQGLLNYVQWSQQEIVRND